MCAMEYVVCRFSSMLSPCSVSLSLHSVRTRTLTLSVIGVRQWALACRGRVRCPGHCAMMRVFYISFALFSCPFLPSLAPFTYLLFTQLYTLLWPYVHVSKTVCIGMTAGPTDIRFLCTRIVLPSCRPLSQIHVHAHARMLCPPYPCIYVHFMHHFPFLPSFYLSPAPGFVLLVRSCPA